MKRHFLLSVLAVSLVTFSVPSPSQTLKKLQLKQAEDLALQNNPQIQSALLNALAANEIATIIGSLKYPQVNAHISGAGATEEARLAAGGLNNPIILSRAAIGVSVNQLVYDNGRLDNLVESARLKAQAIDQNVQASRAQIIFQVNRAYFLALKAQAVLRVAEKTVKSRELVAEQVEALRQSGLKSGLDASFANYNLAEAKLLQVKAQNDLAAAYAELSQALGDQTGQVYELAEENLPSPIAGQGFIAEALQKRPEISALKFEAQAAQQFLLAEKKLHKPNVNILWNTGWVPFGDTRLSRYYNAVGVNINIPIFNGNLFKGREAEAGYKAKAAEQSLQDFSNRIARDVRVTELSVSSSFERIKLTEQLSSRAKEALDLAQERYRLGLSSIVEFNQAQLQVTVAEIENAQARYDYLIQRALLRYHTASQ
jgi:outer membrane protein